MSPDRDPPRPDDDQVYAPARPLPVDPGERTNPMRRFGLPAELEAQARHAQRTRQRVGRRRPWRRPPLEQRDYQLPADKVILAAIQVVHRKCPPPWNPDKKGTQKIREDVVNGVRNYVNTVRKWAADSGNGAGDTNWEPLIRALYAKDKLAPHDDVVKAFQGAVRRWAWWARQAGLVELIEVTDPETGASAGLRWRLLDPLVDSFDPAGVAQSVEATLTHGGRVHRKETRREQHERSHRRWCRSSGRGTVGRLDTHAAPLSFGGEDRSIPSCPSLRSSEKGGLRARRASAREAGDGPLARLTAGTERRRVRQAANELYQACQPRIWAPPEAVLRGFSSQTRLDRIAQAGPLLEQAARDGVHPAAVGLVAMDLAFDRAGPPILSHRAIERIVRHAATLDRCDGQRGAGALALVDAIVEHAELVKAGRAVRPEALGFFATALRQAARRAARRARPAAAERVQRRRERRRARVS